MGSIHSKASPGTVTSVDHLNRKKRSENERSIGTAFDGQLPIDAESSDSGPSNETRTIPGGRLGDVTNS